MRLLITGSSGFIGRQLVASLSAHGHAVVGLDRVPLANTQPNVEARAVDLLDRDALTRTFVDCRPEAVIHLAARTDLDEKHDLAGYAANIEGTENIVAAVREAGVRRAIYTSSQLVCRVGYVPRSDLDYRPNTLYGESKVRTEQIVRAAKGGSDEWCIVRPTTVWGPGMQPHYQRFFRMISEGRYFHVSRKPLFKSYAYVGNLIFQYEKLLTVEPAAILGRTLYLADYEPISLRDWADAFQRALGAPPIRSLPEIFAHAGAVIGDLFNRAGWRNFPYNSFRLGNVLAEYVFDLSKTREACGPLPFSTQDGIEATVRWLRAEGVLRGLTAVL